MTQEEILQLTELLDTTFDQKLKPITLHLERIDKRLEGMDKRFDLIEKRLGHLEKEQKTTNEMITILLETAGTHSEHEKLTKRVTRIEDHLGLSHTP